MNSSLLTPVSCFHNEFPSDIGNDTVNVIIKFVIKQNYYIPRISWWIYSYDGRVLGVRTYILSYPED